MEEKKKYAYCEPFRNTREMIKFINEEGREIPKEDIVTVLNINGQLLLIYYR